MKPFKFFQTEQEAFRERLLGIIDNVREINRGPIQEPPYGLSNRHWNILPEHMRSETEQHIVIYLQGWESNHVNQRINPYQDIERREFWNEGFWAYEGRRQILNPTRL